MRESITEAVGAFSIREKAPNFCCSECAGSVSVALGGQRRRIAERQH